MIDETAITAALARVPGFDGRTPLTQSGAIGGMTHRDGKVYLSLVVEPAMAERAETTRLAAENAVKAVPGVTAAIVTLTSERAPVAAAAPAHRHAPQRPTGPKQVEGIRHMLAVASGKGGVGKSTTAVNIAVAMALEGRKVGLLDADVFGPSAPRLLGLTGRKPKMSDTRLEPLQAFGVRVMSIGFLVEEDSPIVWRGPMVMSAITQLLREVDWGELDCLVIDMPPGTGDVQLTMAQNAPLSGAVIVSTPQDLALLDARRGIGMFDKVNIPTLGIIENMSYFVCPHCGGRTDVFSHGGAKAEAQKRGVPFLGEIPLDIVIRETSDAGRPVVVAAPDGPLAAAYRNVARAVLARLDAEGPRAAPKIVIQ